MRVTVKKSKNILFIIQRPDVFKSPNSDTYIIFGEAKIEDLSAQAQTQAAEQFRTPDVSAEPTPAAAKTAGTTTTDKACLSPLHTRVTPSFAFADTTADDDVDTTGVDAKDIELVMNQANCSKAKAVAALRNNDNDIVNAIMEVTM
jgi:nascent polypeptide-associated complex subunit alpha